MLSRMERAAAATVELHDLIARALVIADELEMGDVGIALDAARLRLAECAPIDPPQAA